MYSLRYAFFGVLFAGCWSWIHTRVACCAPSIVHKTFLYLDLKILISKLLCIQYPALHPPSNTAHTHTNPAHATTTTGRHLQFSILSICLSVYLSIGGDEDEPHCGFLALWISPHQNQGQGHACQDRVRTRTKQSVSLTDWIFFSVACCCVSGLIFFWMVVRIPVRGWRCWSGWGINQWDIGILE